MPELVTKYSELRAFADDALPFLLEDEALHNLQLGITNHMLGNPDSKPVFLATLRSESGAVVGAAMMSPGHHLVLSGGSDSAMNELCRAVDCDGIQLPGVFGPSHCARFFADAWCAPRSLRPRTATRMALFVLHDLRFPRLPSGTAVDAASEHLPLVADWTQQFYLELNLNSPPPSAAVLRQRVESRNVLLWVLPGSGPVSLATVGRGSPNGATVTTVYTPPPFRGQGFASACVAQACQSAFDRGKRFCTLYADLDNMTSTGLYARLGFQHLANSDDIAFES